jgi:hypothetical protein
MVVLTYYTFVALTFYTLHIGGIKYFRHYTYYTLHIGGTNILHITHAKNDDQLLRKQLGWLLQPHMANMHALLNFRPT